MNLKKIFWRVENYFNFLKFIFIARCNLKGQNTTWKCTALWHFTYNTLLWLLLRAGNTHHPPHNYSCPFLVITNTYKSLLWVFLSLNCSWTSLKCRYTVYTCLYLTSFAHSFWECISSSFSKFVFIFSIARNISYW